MSFLDVLASMISSFARSTAQQRAEFSRTYEREHPNMTDAERSKFEDFNRMTDKLADVGDVSVTTTLRRTSDSQRINIKKDDVLKWDSQWEYIGYLNTTDLLPFSHSVGLYRFERLGHVVYVGSATELTNGGLRKELRRHQLKTDNPVSKADKLIGEHIDELEVYVLVVGNSADAIDITRVLKGNFINRYRPLWNS